MKLFYINSTHWDREWYAPFQHFRYNLVETLNELIDILETDPEYKIFTLDGQTIVLEDYAEIEPENAEKLKGFIKEGRIVIGPWYVMPDEYLVSGESLVKNLSVGHKIAEKWGVEPLKYGYANDIFGHIAQFPQILKGFGIEGAYIGRGLGNTDFNHFVWRSPDGTECLTSIGLYGAFITGKLKHYGTEEFPAILKEWIEIAQSRSEAPVVFFSNTHDHIRADRRTPEILNMIREQFPEMEVCDVKLSEMAEELKKHKAVLPTVSGELSEPRDNVNHPACNLTLLYHCLSAHYPLKQQNDYCQNLLETRVEPMLAMASIDQKPLNRNFLNTAWKWLLQNHPHDSICGCSGDRVHGQMTYRFEQTEDISNRLYEAFCDGQRTVSPDGDKTDYIIKVYNTLGVPVDKTHTVKVAMKGFSTVRQGYALKERHNNFRLLDQNGNELCYQIDRIDRSRVLRTSSVAQKSDIFDIYIISFKAPVPAMGHASFRIVPEEKRVAFPDKMSCGENWAENNLVRLEIGTNGRLTLTDKRNGKVYTNLCGFNDNGEVGDGWHHESPMNDFTVTDFATPAEISLISSGAVKTVFKVTKHLKVPQYLDAKKLDRSELVAELKITSIITLNRDSANVTVETEIDNTARDHRLKLMLPTNVDGDTYFAGQAFCKISRPVGTDPKKASWDEPECIERNMNGIIGKQSTSGEGLAFVSAEGLHEAGVLNDADSTVAVTLYRCFDRVYMQTKSNLPQLMRRLTFKYSIVPMTAETSYADLLCVQHGLKNTEITVTDKVSADTPTPQSDSYFEIENPNIALSLFKVSEDNKDYVIRMFNASEMPTESNITFGCDVAGACEVDLLENATEELCLNGKSIKLGFRPWEIKTIKFAKA